ncbi:MAG: hypothetical protein H7242_19255 [Microbacteriaceae bacterium]|nr:hypothetical protein [Burkholderiaceae bacterium]
MTPQPSPRATSRQRRPLTPADQACPAPAWVFALVPEGQIDAALLTGLAAALAAQGTPLQTQRMRFDRQYALERLAQAHCSSDPVTRQLAMGLFDAYQASPAAPGDVSG